jgi:unsaturated rhamnogalacturonyl hydrolase
MRTEVSTTHQTGTSVHSAFLLFGLSVLAVAPFSWGASFSIRQGAEPLAEMCPGEDLVVRYQLGTSANGSFSMESGGLRWIGEGHPFLWVDGQKPLDDAYANFNEWSPDPDFMFAAGYLSELHAGRLRNVSRGVGLCEGRYVVIRDNVRSLGKPVRIRWQLHALTEDVSLDSKGVTIRKGGQVLKVRVQGPDDLEMKSWPVSSPGGAEAALVGFEFTLPAETSQNLEVLLVPEGAQNLAAFVGQSFGKVAADTRIQEGKDIVDLLGSSRSPLKLDALDATAPADIRVMLEQACYWQFENLRPFWNQGLIGWVHGSFYTGVLDLFRQTQDERYLNALTQISERYDWRLLRVNGLEWRRADNHLMGEIYLNLALENEALREVALEDVTRIYDRMIEQPWPGRELYDWADALYMSPPTWALLAKATGNARYLQELDTLYWDVMDHLYSPEWQLVFRDARFIDQVEENGKPVFWGRGVGWVYGGLVNLLRYLPADWSTRPKYEELYQALSKRLADIQMPSGGWASSLLYPEMFEWATETSSSGFFVYGLAWGINQGLLDRAEFGPAVDKGWRNLVEHLNADGSIRNIQQVGASPEGYDGGYLKRDYGYGAFLLAGVQMARYFDLPPSLIEVAESTQPDGSWSDIDDADTGRPLQTQKHADRPSAGRYARVDMQVPGRRGSIKRKASVKAFVDDSDGEGIRRILHNSILR